MDTLNNNPGLHDATPYLEHAGGSAGTGTTDDFDDTAPYREDVELAALILAGNSEAEEKFVVQHRLWIEKEIRWQGVPASDVEDVAQHIFLAAFQQLRRGIYHGQSSLKTWLHKIVHGKVIDYWRKQPPALLALWSEREAASETEALVTEAAAVQLSPELVISVHEVLRQMPQDLQQVLVLNRTGGYTIQEISYALALTTGQVAKRLYKAEVMFRQLLNRYDLKEQPENRTAVAQKKRLPGGDGRKLLLFLWRCMASWFPQNVGSLTPCYT